VPQSRWTHTHIPMLHLVCACEPRLTVFRCESVAVVCCSTVLKFCVAVVSYSVPDFNDSMFGLECILKDYVAVVCCSSVLQQCAQ